VRGLVRQHIASFDYLVDEEIRAVALAPGNKEVRCDADRNWYLRYTDVCVGRPSLEDGYVVRPSTPQQCRLRDATYAAPLMANIEFTRGKEVVRRERPGGAVEIGRLPLMLRSKRCALWGKKDSELAALGECPLDPGGYFVVRGAEKVVMVQEQLSKNRVLVSRDAHDQPTAAVTSSTHERKSKTHVVIRGGRLYVKHNAFSEDLNAILVLRALGVESDLEAITSVGPEPAVAARLASTAAEAAATLSAHARAQAAAGLANAVDHTGAGDLDGGGGTRLAGVGCGRDQLAALDYLGSRIKAPLAQAAQQAATGGQNGGAAAPAAAAARLPAAPLPPPRRSRAEEARDLLAGVVLAHVPAPRYRFGAKARFLCYMMRRVVIALEDPPPPGETGGTIDDLDYYGNKRLELAGSLLGLLFEDLFKRLNAELRKQAEAQLSKGAGRAAPFDVSKYVRPDIITHGLESAVASGNWTVRRFRMERRGMTQVLSRLSFLASVGTLTRVVSQFEKTRKVSGPRALQPSQWGMLCPVDTPEGESCGLVKNLALAAHVTQEEDGTSAERLCLTLGTEPHAALAPGDLWGTGPSRGGLVLVNGLPLGVHRQPRRLVDGLRIARRDGRLPLTASVSLSGNRVVVSTDGGRVCRPLIVCDPRTGEPKVTEDHARRLRMGQFPISEDGSRLPGSIQFDDLLRCGVVEYLDVCEEADAFVALDKSGCRPGITHLEIEPFALLGVVAGLVPFPHHNQSPRNTYQCAMGKQAIGSVAYNQGARLDALLYVLGSPQRPLVSTRTVRLVGFDRLGAGQNAVVAVMSYTGYDIEDAVIVNKASLDRGFGRCSVLRRVGTTIKRYANRTMDRVNPPPLEEPPAAVTRGEDGALVKPRESRFSRLDHDGLARVGDALRPGDVYINKATPSDTRDPVPAPAAMPDAFYRPCPLVYRGATGETARVDRVLLTSNQQDSIVVKVLLRQTRRPERGDKFSSRHGQKGVVGLVAAETDLPFSERGIAPDLVMNPHGFPSRMTVGKLLELVSAKAGALAGRTADGTAFADRAGGEGAWGSGLAGRGETGRPGAFDMFTGKDLPPGFDPWAADPLGEAGAALAAAGYSYLGKDSLTSGTTGEPLPGLVFMGPVYYQRLKHMVLDKMHARATGPRVLLTRQPTEGRARDGGLRLGEMERDCLVAHGASLLLLERLMTSSDECVVQVCGACGQLGSWDFRRGCGTCARCARNDRVSALRVPYACKLLFQELQAMNISPRLALAEA